MRKVLWTIVLLFVLAAPARAQVTIPNTFVPNTTISSTDVNANFAALGNQALNRRAGRSPATSP